MENIALEHDYSDKRGILQLKALCSGEFVSQQRGLQHVFACRREASKTSFSLSSDDTIISGLKY